MKAIGLVSMSVGLLMSLLGLTGFMLSFLKLAAGREEAAFLPLTSLLLLGLMALVVGCGAMTAGTWLILGDPRGRALALGSAWATSVCGGIGLVLLVHRGVEEISTIAGILAASLVYPWIMSAALRKGRSPGSRSILSTRRSKAGAAYRFRGRL